MKYSDTWRTIVLILSLSILSCCNKNPKPEATETSSPAPANTKSPIGNYVPAVGRVETATDFREFAGYYMTYTMTEKTPQSLADMPLFQRDKPKSYKRFADGEYVVLWGGDLRHAPAGTSMTILAYEKDVPEKGGVVLFLDGHSDNVSAQEFQTFAKPNVK